PVYRCTCRANTEGFNRCELSFRSLKIIMIKTNNAICFGEVLWDVFDKGKQIGGAPLNVCYHLSQLGITSKIVSQVGNDQNGKDILAQLHAMGLGDHYCEVSDTYPTSTVVVKPSG